MSTKYMGSNALAKLCEIVKSAVSALEAAIPTKTSDLTNDSGFLTTDTFSQTYATKTELQEVDDMVSTKVDATDYALAMRSMDEAKLDKSTITINSTESAGKTAASGTATKICSLTLPAGTWLIMAEMKYGTNTSGYRAMCVNTAVAWNSTDGVLVSAPPTQGAILRTATAYTLTSSKTYYMVAYQNSGSTLDCNGWMQAVRLK